MQVEMQNNMFRIEKMKEEDVLICAEAVYSTDFGRLYYPSVKILERLLREGLERDFIYTAKKNGTVLGFIWFSLNSMFGKFPYLNFIFVLEPYKKKGVGRELIKHFEKTAFQICKNPPLKVFLVVKNNNENAIRFYQKNGYDTVGTIQGLFRASVNEIFMMKHLNLCNIG